MKPENGDQWRSDEKRKGWHTDETRGWRPLEAPGVTKNVLIATDADGSLMHFHTTSGKILNRIHSHKNPLLTCDYKPDGLEFLTGGEDGKVRVYDERTR